MTIVMVGGDFDLSVGSMASLTGIIGAVLMQQGSPILVAIGVSILAGLAGGILNGLLVAYARLSAFVATLGTLTLFGGLALLTSDGKTLFGRSIPEAVGNFGRGSLLLFEDISVPYLTLIALVVLILVGILLRQTIVGRQLHAVGGNQEASRLAGIPVAKLRVMAFAINGIGAAVAGLMLVSRLSSANPTQGEGLMLTTLAAVFVGGTSVFGGKGTIFGTFIGVLIIGSLESGIVALGLSGFYVKFINGLMITVAVTVYALIQRRKN